MKLNVIIVFIMLLSQFVTSFAQDKLKTVQDDIEIMETILSKMFNKNQFNAFQNKVNGFYLDEYGVLFEIPFSSHKIYHNITIRNDNDGDNLIIIANDEKIIDPNKHIQIEKVDYDKIFQQELTQTKTIIKKFLGNYSSAISGLKPDHWITINVDFDASNEWISVLQKEKSVKKLIAKVQKKYVSDYHREKISFKNFNKKIQFKVKDNNTSDMDDDMDVFKNIIESFLKKETGQSNYHVKGIYLSGYGVIFMFNTNFEPDFCHIFANESGDKNSYSYAVQSYISKGTKSVQTNEEIEKLQNKILDLMTRFGHTMHKLNKNEWLEIATNINSNNPEIDYSKMILKIKMSSIEELKQQKITKKDFKRRMKILKY